MRILIGIIRILLFITFAVGFAVIISAIVTDPYNKYTIVRSPFYTEVVENQRIELKQWSTPAFYPPASRAHTQDPFGPYFDFVSQKLSYVRTGLRIALYSILGESKLKGNETEIINQIHAERFDPGKAYVITGGHYSDLYMRNLGVFYNALLDPYFPSSGEDFQNRQRIALQTIALDLEYLKDQRDAATTIVPLNGSNFTGLNIYAYPSDSMYAVLNTLDVMLKDQPFAYLYNGAAQPRPHLTSFAVRRLIVDHRLTLRQSTEKYLTTVLDPETRLVKTDLQLSSARDGVKRSSSFYDNVIAWKTVQLAKKFEVPIPETLDEQTWKQKIIQTYWLEEQGMFKDDAKNTHFSADSFIVLSTQFLDPNIPEDRQKLERMIAYVRANKLDYPFPLKYSKTNAENTYHGPVKYFAPSYMGEGIWSHWGMEYIKTLIVLGYQDPGYLIEAEKHLATYRKNIEETGGYPELYDARGKRFHSLFVRTVLHTGWVVNYEQAKAMLDLAK